MSDTVVVMNQGWVQQIGTPESVYNEPENAFVADFIGDSNIIDGIMVRDKLVHLLGKDIPCINTGFGENVPVDVQIRPEDIQICAPEDGQYRGTIRSVVFKGTVYDITIEAGGFSCPDNHGPRAGPGSRHPPGAGEHPDHGQACFGR